jgi:hypothetical protein
MTNLEIARRALSEAAGYYGSDAPTRALTRAVEALIRIEESRHDATRWPEPCPYSFGVHDCVLDAGHEGAHECDDECDRECSL